MYYTEAIAFALIDIYSFVKKYINWFVLQLNFYILWRLFTARFYINGSKYEANLRTYDQRLFAKTLIENEGIMSIDDFMEDDLYINIDGNRYFIMYTCVPHEKVPITSAPQTVVPTAVVPTAVVPTAVVPTAVVPTVNVMLITSQGFEDVDIKFGDFYYFGMITMQS